MRTNQIITGNIYSSVLNVSILILIVTILWVRDEVEGVGLRAIVRQQGIKSLQNLTLDY